MGDIGFPEMFLIMAIVAVLFGAGKLPQLGRSLGEGIANFKEGLRGKDKPLLEEEPHVEPPA